MKYAKKSSKSSKSVKTFKKKNVKISKPISFEKKVLSVIHKQTEDKAAYITSSESNLTLFNSGISVAGDVLKIIPNISKGTSVNERIADKINLMKHSIRGYIRFSPPFSTADAKFSSVMVRMFVLSFKNVSNYDNAINDTTLTTKLAGLLQKGGTTVGFTGLISDLMSSVNRDVFTVHYDKTFYLSQERVITTPLSGITADVSDAIKFFNFSMKVKNKKLCYSDDISSDLLPSNYAPFLCFGYSYLDGSSPDTISANLGVFYESEMIYED